jgi:hypothetical protein
MRDKGHVAPLPPLPRSYLPALVRTTHVRLSPPRLFVPPLPLLALSLLLVPDSLPLLAGSWFAFAFAFIGPDSLRFYA